MRIAVVAGHVGIEQLRADGLCAGRDLAELRRSTGTRGEREWTGDAAARLAAALTAAGHSAFATDSTGGDDVRSAQLDLVIALHLQRDSADSHAFAGAPNPASDYVSAAAAADSQRWCDLFHVMYPRTTGIAATPGRVNANMTEHYLWCYIDSETRAVIVECGNADADAAVLYELNMARVIAALVEITNVWAGGGSPIVILPPAGGVAQPLPPMPVLLAGPSPRIPYPSMLAALWRANSRALTTVVRLYADLAPIAGIDPVVAFAQAMKETAWLTFPRIAQPAFHNYAGIGCSEITRQCATWATEEEGVRGHLGHLLCYFGEHQPPFCDLDPRHDLVGHKHLANDVRQLGGRWAPAPDYGDRIVALAATILAS